MVEVGSNVVQRLKFVDGRCWKVLTRLVDIALFRVPDRPRRARATSKRGEGLKLLRSEVEEAARATTHSLRGGDGKGRYGFKVCFLRPEPGRLVAVWQSSYSAAPFVQYSHKLDKHRGLAYCVQCGAYTVKRVVNLGKACKATEQCSENLRRILDDRLPAGLPSWPDE